MTIPKFTKEQLELLGTQKPPIENFDPIMRVNCEDGTVYVAGYLATDKQRIRLVRTPEGIKEVIKPMTLLRISWKKGEQRRELQKGR